MSEAAKEILSDEEIEEILKDLPDIINKLEDKATK